MIERQIDSRVLSATGLEHGIIRIRAGGIDGRGARDGENLPVSRNRRIAGSLRTDANAGREMTVSVAGSNRYARFPA